MSEKAEAEARRIYESFGCMEIWDFAKVIDDVIAAAEKRGRVAGLREAGAFIDAALMHGVAGDSGEVAETMSYTAMVFKTRADKLEAETP